MITIYRLSDNGYVKPKLPCATKMICLKNFTNVYGIVDHIILDNCCEETIAKIENGNYAKFIHKTNLGNAPSFLYAMELALSQSENIYFVEDDYLHRGNIIEAITDGLSLADYCTLYDHPDKYSLMYNCGETCKVLRKNNKHWKTSISTTMTFACSSETIKKDAHIFKSICKNQFHPNDHEIFQRLHSEIGRSLVSPLPGMALHADLTTYLSNIDTIGFEIDEWALDTIINLVTEFILKLEDENKIQKMQSLFESAKNNVKGKLVLIHAIENLFDPSKIK